MKANSDRLVDLSRGSEDQRRPIAPAGSPMRRAGHRQIASSASIPGRTGQPKSLLSSLHSTLSPGIGCDRFTRSGEYKNRDSVMATVSDPISLPIWPSVRL